MTVEVGELYLQPDISAHKTVLYVENIYQGKTVMGRQYEFDLRSGEVEESDNQADIEDFKDYFIPLDSKRKQSFVKDLFMYQKSS